MTARFDIFDGDDPRPTYDGGDVSAVQRSPEFLRIQRLRRRVWTEAETKRLVYELTKVLRTPHGTMELRPHQAIAIYELITIGGLFCPLGIGFGKTLISLLAPWVLKAQRPMLVVPASLIEKTRRDQIEYMQHFCIPTNIRIESYELMSRASSENAFKVYRPDLLGADEGHKLRDPDTAITKRFREYMRLYPETPFATYSGTFANHSIKDFAHLLEWALKKKNSPFPTVRTELEEWASAIDEKAMGPGGAGGDRGPRRVGLGALLDLCEPGDFDKHPDPIDACRNAVRRRMTEAPGVIASSEGVIGTSLQISSWVLDVPEIEPHVKKLLDEAETPGGEMLMEAIVIWAKNREIALGLYTKWDPPAPFEWKEKRKLWAQVCRYILRNNHRSLFSPLMVANAIDAGLYPEATQVLNDWREIEPSFVPNPVPVWLTDRVVKAVAKRIVDRPGTICWTEHVAFAEELSRLSNVPYYGEMGLDVRGRFIDDADPSKSIIASIHANMAGRNLQAWNHNLFTSIHPNGSRMEQALGRTHRSGQKADTVTAELLFSGGAHVNAWDKVQDNARYLELTTSNPQKLRYADITVDVPWRPENRWRVRSDDD